MDNDLIDRSLAELQGLPFDKRTPEQLQIWLSFICEAAGIELGHPTSFHHEHCKLEAAVLLLAQQLGADRYFVSLRLSSSTSRRLCAFLYIDDEPSHHAYGSGQTAVEVTTQLRADVMRIRKEAA